MAKLKKKAKRSLSLLVIILALSLIGVFGYRYIFTGDNNLKDKIKEKIEEKKEDPIKVYKANLIATGDALIHSPLYKAAYNSTTNSYDFSSMLSYTKEKIKDYDLKYYNQETVFDDSKSPQSYPMFITPSALGDNMIDAGFNLVSLATNHSMDGGNESAKRSASWWESKDNILATGMASSPEKRTDYQIKEINNIKYTMLSYTYGTNGIAVQEDYTVNVYNEEKVLNDIAAVRDQVDVLIVAMHWGIEYNTSATQEQRNQAKFLADNGVDIILGTHSHCIEPWEWIDDTVVFYSFGNFISNQMGAEEARVRKVGTIGMFATLDITKTVDTEKNTTEIKIDNIGADLNYSYRYFDSSINKYNYTVIPFSKMDEKYLSNYQSVYDEFSGILKTYDDSINIEPTPYMNINNNDNNEEDTSQN